MINKKSQNFSIIAIILIILGIVVLVLLIIGFTKGWDFVLGFLTGESKFKTYKEGCRNEIYITSCKLSQEDYEEIVCQKCNTFKSEEELLDCIDKRVECQDKFHERVCVSLEEEICKQIEVDEIVFYEKQSLINSSELNCRAINEIWMNDNCFIELHYFKQDLTIEWLDENCECSKICPPKYGGLPPSECKVKYCYKYKCGDYFVEVIK